MAGLALFFYATEDALISVALELHPGKIELALLLACAAGPPAS